MNFDYSETNACFLNSNTVHSYFAPCGFATIENWQPNSRSAFAKWLCENCDQHNMDVVYCQIVIPILAEVDRRLVKALAYSTLLFAYCGQYNTVYFVCLSGLPIFNNKKFNNFFLSRGTKSLKIFIKL
jgi:hypothetical protein